MERVLLRRSSESMYLVLGGHIFFETLSAAVELDLFGLLQAQGKLTREQIAQTLKLELQPVRILLLGCVTIGLIRKSGSYYSNTLMSKQLFVRESKRNIIDVVRWQHHINYKAMFHFEDAIRANSNVGLSVFAGTEPTLYQRLVHDPRLEGIFQDAMRGISVQANQTIALNLDLSRTKHLVDVGGGNGTNIMTLAGKYPHLRATVFDSPTVCEIAKKRIEDARMSDRLGVAPGDCFVDPFPATADCILFAHFFTIWSESENRQLLKKCYDSLPSGGAVVIFNMMQRDSEDGPHSAAMGSPYFLTLATGKGMLYTWNEYMQWMKDAGFATVTRQVLPRDHGLITARKG